MEENNVKKSPFTVKNALRVLAALCLILAFCPTLVYDWYFKRSMLTAIGGTSSFGFTVIPAQPVLAACLAIPVVILILLVVKKSDEHKATAIIAVLSVVDLIMWLTAKVKGRRYGLDVWSTGWYVLAIILLVIMIVLSVLVLLQVLRMENDLTEVASAEKIQEALHQRPAAAERTSAAPAPVGGGEAKEKRIACFCAECGSPVEYGTRFCAFCGTSVQRKAEEKAAAKAPETGGFCTGCGKPLEAGGRFCVFCGAPVPQKAQEEIAAKEPETGGFCAECGKPLEAEARFCVFCGASAPRKPTETVKAAETAETAEITEPVAGAEETTERAVEEDAPTAEEETEQED